MPNLQLRNILIISTHLPHSWIVVHWHKELSKMKMQLRNILKAQMGKTINARIKHFSNSFPVYRLPVHTNVDADAPVPWSFSILLYLALDWYWYSTQCLRLSTSKFSGTTRACTMWLYYTISTPAFRAPPLLLLMTIVNAHRNNLGWHGLRMQRIKWNQVSM